MLRRLSPPRPTMAVFLSWVTLLGAQACLGWIALLPSFQGPACRAWASSSTSQQPPPAPGGGAAAAAGPAYYYYHHHQQCRFSTSGSRGGGGLSALSSSSSPSSSPSSSSSSIRSSACHDPQQQVRRGGSSSPPSSSYVGSLLQRTCGGAARGRLARHAAAAAEASSLPPAAADAVLPNQQQQHSSTTTTTTAVEADGPSTAIDGDEAASSSSSPATTTQEGSRGPRNALLRRLLPSSSPPPSPPRWLVGGGVAAAVVVGAASYYYLTVVNPEQLGTLLALAHKAWDQHLAPAAQAASLDGLPQEPPTPAGAGGLTGFDYYWRIFLAGGVCAAVSHGWAVPLDVVKTRLQTDPDKYYNQGIWQTFNTIRREEGPGMLLKGMGATLIGYSIQGSLKYGLYAIFKAAIGAALPLSGIFVVWVLASIAADVFASTALCPLEATRIRLVADPSYAKGTADGLARMVRSEGPGSIFRGMPAILAKQLPYTIVQLCGFELLTRLAYSWDATAALLAHPSPLQWIVSFASAMITGVFASLASQPGDAILSRVNKEGGGSNKKAVLSLMADTVRELGVRGLYRGTKARLLHVGLIVTVQLVIYDAVKQMVGLPATGAH